MRNKTMILLLILSIVFLLCACNPPRGELTVTSPQIVEEDDTASLREEELETAQDEPVATEDQEIIQTDSEDLNEGEDDTSSLSDELDSTLDEVEALFNEIDEILAMDLE